MRPSLDDEVNKRLEDELSFLPPEDVSSVIRKPPDVIQNSTKAPKLEPTIPNSYFPSSYNQVPQTAFMNKIYEQLKSNIQKNAQSGPVENSENPPEGYQILTPSASIKNEALASLPPVPPTCRRDYTNSSPPPGTDDTKPDKEEYRGKSRYLQNPQGSFLSCKECGASLKTKASLEVHIKARHMLIKDFRCDFCDYKSAQKGAIGGHMRATHNKTEKYECNACKKILDGKREATYHAKEHRGTPSGFENQFTPRVMTFIEP